MKKAIIIVLLLSVLLGASCDILGISSLMLEGSWLWENTSNDTWEKWDFKPNDAITISGRITGYGDYRMDGNYSVSNGILTIDIDDSSTDIVCDYSIRGNELEITLSGVTYTYVKQ